MNNDEPQAGGSWNVENLNPPEIPSHILEDLRDISDLITIPQGDVASVEKKGKKSAIKKKTGGIKTKPKSLLLHEEIHKYRNPFPHYPPKKNIFCSKLKKQKGGKSIFSKDMEYRVKSIDQLDYLVKLGSAHMYFLRKLGIVIEIEKICDILNNFVHTHTVSELTSKNKNAAIMKTIIDIEEENICCECISLVSALLRLANKNSSFKKIEEWLAKSNWSELPSDYAKYIEKYMSPYVVTDSINVLF